MLDAALLCTIALGCMGFADKIPPGNWWRWLNNTFFKIIIFLIATIISAHYSSQKELKTENDKALSDSLHFVQLKRNNDSLQNNFVIALRANSDSNIKTFTNALADYHLDYVNGQVLLKSLIKDSISKEIPGLAIYDDKIVYRWNSLKDSLTTSVYFSNVGNCPVLVTLTAYVTTNFKNVDKGEITEDMIIPQSSGLSKDFYLHSLVPELPDQYYILLRGKYSTTTKSQVKKIDELIYLEKDLNRFTHIIQKRAKDSLENIILHCPPY